MVYSGLAMPINDILIMKDDKSVPAGSVGEVWLRGPNVMKGYWKDQAATDKVPSFVYARVGGLWLSLIFLRF